MALLPEDRFGQYMMLLAVVAGAGGYFYWNQLYSPRTGEIGKARQEIDSLQRQVDGAKAELATGTVEDLRRRAEGFNADLELMRRLVPERNEVPNLIDDIVSRGKIRGVSVADYQPQPVERGSPYDTYRYRFEVVGRFDQIGEFLSDIASLQRVIAPTELSLERARQDQERAFGDSTGALLQATFIVKTYVKSDGPGVSS